METRVSLLEYPELDTDELFQELPDPMKDSFNPSLQGNNRGSLKRTQTKSFF
jgi:hypothetical protein